VSDMARTISMDEDVRDDGLDIFSNVPAVRQDFEIVLPATSSEEELGEEWCRYCQGPCWVRDFWVFGVACSRRRALGS
jgi:hypothetical protein